MSLSSLVRLCAPLILAAMLGACGGEESARGVSDGEIVIGTHQDLTGPLRAGGVAASNGLNMAIDEANAAGGVHGRTIRLLVRDNADDPGQAEAAVESLVRGDQVFAVIGAFGTPAVLAAIRRVIDSGTLHLFPLTAAREAFEPLHPLKFALLASYADIMRQGVRYLTRQFGVSRVAVLYRNDAFGEDVKRGVESELRAQGLTPAGAVTFAPGAESLEAEVESLKMKDVDAIVIAGASGETIAAMKAVHALGWVVPVLGSPASYMADVAASPDAEGLYALGQFPIPYPDDANPNLRAWIKRYEDRFGAQATVEALAGYAAGRIFIAGLEATGRDVTAESFSRALEAMAPWSPDGLGIAPIDYGATDHLGARTAFIAQARRGRWVMQPAQ